MAMRSILYGSRSSSITPPDRETGWNRRPSRSPLLRSDPVRRSAPPGVTCVLQGDAGKQHSRAHSTVAQCAFVLIGRVGGRRELGAVRDGKLSAIVVDGGIRGALRSIVDAVATAAAISSELRELKLEALQALGVGSVVTMKGGMCQWTALEVSRVVTRKGRRWTIVRRMLTVMGARARSRGPIVALTVGDWSRAAPSQEGGGCRRCENRRSCGCVGGSASN